MKRPSVLRAAALGLLLVLALAVEASAAGEGAKLADY